MEDLKKMYIMFRILFCAYTYDIYAEKQNRINNIAKKKLRRCIPAGKSNYIIE